MQKTTVVKYESVHISCVMLRRYHPEYCVLLLADMGCIPAIMCFFLFFLFRTHIAKLFKFVNS